MADMITNEELRKIMDQVRLVRGQFNRLVGKEGREQIAAHYKRLKDNGILDQIRLIQQHLDRMGRIAFEQSHPLPGAAADAEKIIKDVLATREWDKWIAFVRQHGERVAKMAEMAPKLHGAMPPALVESFAELAKGTRVVAEQMELLWRTEGLQWISDKYREMRGESDEI